MVNVFTRFGMPAEILSDRGTEFESELFSQLLRWLEVDKLRTTAYKTSTNAVVERFHRTLNTILGTFVSTSQRDWDERLPYALMAYRATIHRSTVFTPNRLFLGRENRLPVDLVMGLPVNEINGELTVDEYVERQQQLAEETFQLIREHLSRNAQRRKFSYDAKVREQTYAVGESVWYYYPRKYTKKSPKWQRCYVGPYRVTRVSNALQLSTGNLIDAYQNETCLWETTKNSTEEEKDLAWSRLSVPVNYVIQRSSKSKPFVVHADKLKKCFSAPTSDWIVPDSADESGPAAAAVPPTPAALQFKPRLTRRKEQRSPRQLVSEATVKVKLEVEDSSLRPTRERRTPTYLRDYACRNIRRQN